MDISDKARGGPHESWCDTQNNISSWCNCVVSTYLDQITDLEKLLEDAYVETDGEHWAGGWAMAFREYKKKVNG